MDSLGANRDVDGHPAVNPHAAESPKPRGPRRWLRLLAPIGAALTLWLALGRPSGDTPRSSERSPRERTELHSAERLVEPRSTANTPPRVVTAVAERVKSAPALVNVATDGLPFMPAAADAPQPSGPVHPHPITAEHARIFRENATIQALNDAMDSGDAQALRRFLGRYRDEYPEDAQQLQRGYGLIADCLEQRPGYRAAARSYFDEERGSSLRRFVLRHCLGGP